ncbi:hypothetical protein HY772_09820 [Candidatus Woesearchaeota archaeon]|nr:hypothetical protein [Candidatus Woesearchaeota archaeon]
MVHNKDLEDSQQDLITGTEDIIPKIEPSAREDQRIILATSIDAAPLQRSGVLTNPGARSLRRNIPRLGRMQSLADEEPSRAAQPTRTASPRLNLPPILPPIEPENRPAVASKLAQEALRDIESDPRLAVQKIEAAKELMPEKYDLLHTSAQIYFQSGDPLQAQRELRVAETLYRQSHRDQAVSEVDSAFLIAQARAHSSLQDHERSLSLLDEILRAEPDHIEAKIQKALVLLNCIDRKAGLELLLDALPRLKRGSERFHDLKTLAASEIEKLAFDAREDSRKKLQSLCIGDYALQLSRMLPAFSKCVLDLRGVCANAHMQSLSVILQPRKTITSPGDAKDAVTDWAFTYLSIVKESDILEYFRKLSNEQMRQYSGKLIEATNLQPKEMYVLFYSREAPQISLRLSPALKSHCGSRLRAQLMENNICIYDPAELEGFCNAYAQMQSQHGIDVDPNDVKDDFEEHFFSLCDKIIESGGA